jgi:hypothetical protein
LRSSSAADSTSATAVRSNSAAAVRTSTAFVMEAMMPETGATSLTEVEVEHLPAGG